MLPCGLEPFLEQPFELLERLAVDPAEHLDVLERELEGCGLEADVARRIRQHKAEVDVDEVAVAVNQDVAVMSILDLEQVGDDGVT